jgi:hypothetical protein
MFGKLLRNKSVWIIVAIATVIIGIWWFAFGFWLDVLSEQWKALTRVFLGRFLFPGGWNVFKISPWTMLFIGIGVGIYAFYEHVNHRNFRQKNQEIDKRLEYSYISDDERESLENNRPAAHKRRDMVLIPLSALFILMSVLFWWTGTNDKAASYAGSTTFVVADPNSVPSSLSQLVKGGDQSKDCAVATDHGMPGCVVKGEFDGQWYTRNASAAGAKIVLQRTSGTVPNTELLSDTLSYVYNDNGDGVWTAIRDGKGKTPIYGVVSWAGSGNVTKCQFTGDYDLNQAFGGHWGTNLTNTIASQFPDLFYSESDMWGYCDGNQPIVVIPVASQENFAHRRTFRSAGVLIMKGSPSGNPSFQHVTDVKPGQFGGPVYPASLVDQQRENLTAVAGRVNSWFRHFGYGTLDITTQEGNSDDYLLRSKTDNRLYWVTPMKSNKSDSQLVIAYSITPADSAADGRLNEQKVYVLNDDDPRIVNLDDLEARTREALISADPGFYSGRGKLVEFLPASDGDWQVYGEVGGRVVYRILVPADSRVTPTVVSLDSSSPAPGGTTPTEPGTDKGCGADTKSLTDKQLAECLADFANELKDRQK